MNWLVAINWGTSALNLGVLIWSIQRGGNLWWLNLACCVFSFCMGLALWDK